MRCRAAITIGILVFIASTAAGQTPGGGAGELPDLPGNSGVAEPANEGALPAAALDVEEVSPPQWALNLRRAEIVATGSFPLTLLASRLAYSLIRFTVRSIQAGAIDVTYAPWFLAPPGSPELVILEKLAIVGGAVSLSSIIALIDYRRGLAEDEAAE